MEIRWVYITAGSLKEAQTIGRELVTGRLAACVNIIENMRSIYEWQGQLQEDHEVVLIAKTRAETLDRLTAKVLEMHSYECPCVVALPAVGGNREFLNWVADQVA